MAIEDSYWKPLIRDSAKKKGKSRLFKTLEEGKDWRRIPQTLNQRKGKISSRKLLSWTGWSSSIPLTWSHKAGEMHRGSHQDPSCFPLQSQTTKSLTAVRQIPTHIHTQRPKAGRNPWQDWGYWGGWNIKGQQGGDSKMRSRENLSQKL